MGGDGDGPKRLARQAARFFKDEKHEPAPFVWPVLRDCWDFGFGGFKHFPAGTYQAQVERPYGVLELELMRVVYRAWKVLVDTDKEKYAEDEFKFLDWLNEDKRATRTNDMVSRIWQTAY